MKKRTMRKITTPSRWNAWCISLVINVLFLVLMLLLFYPKYTNSGDIIMQNLLYGVIPGLKMAHIVFSNVLLGKALEILIHVFPNVAWYAVAQYFFIFVSLTCLGHMVLRRAPGPMGKVVLIIVLAFMSYEGYITPGYIRTACILTTTGCILLLYAHLANLEGICLEKLLPIVLIVVGSLYSFKVFLISTAICAALGFVYVATNKKRVKLASLAVHLGIVVLTVVALYGLDSLSYRSNPNYSHTLQYKEAYERLFSFGTNPELEEGLVEYGIEGVEQYRALSQGVFLNGTKETLDRLEKVASQSRGVSLKTLDAFFKSIPIELFSVDCFYLWLTLLVLMLVLTDKRGRILVSSLTVMFLGLFILYASYAQQSTGCYFIIIVPAALGLLLYAGDIQEADLKSVVAFLIVLSVVLYSRFSGTLSTGYRLDKVTDAFSKLDEDTYLIDLDAYCKGFNAFPRFPDALVPENVYIVNGFYSTMTSFEQADYVITDESDSRWISNPSGFHAGELANGASQQ